MTWIQKLRDDELFGKVIRNSAHLFTTNSISLALSVLLGMLSVRILGKSDFGLIRVVMAYASTINSIFSFRMSELVVRYGDEYLAKDEKQKAAALIKTAGLTEAAVSVLAFIFVALTASLAGHYLAKTSGVEWIFIVYGIGLLANFNAETSTGILQVTRKIRLQGVINLIQSILAVLVVVAAFFVKEQFLVVLLAYLVAKFVLGLGLFFTAQWQLHKTLGSGWWMKSPLLTFADSREIIRFAISSNISATIIKIFRESELLWVGYFLSLEAVAYYSVAYTLIGFLSVPADPLISAIYPEINRLIVQKAWPRLKDFLHKATTLSFVINIFAALGFIVFGRWALIIYSGHADYAAAYPALIALLIGLSFNYTLFWNRPLLLSLGLPDFPIKATIAVGLVKVVLAFLLIPKYGIVGAGALLSFYYIASVAIMVVRGVKGIRTQEKLSGA